MKIAIIGAGKLGMTLLKTLAPGNHDITIIDTSEDAINKVTALYDCLAVCGNAKEIAFLKENGIDKCDFLVSCTSSDEINIVIASFAKKLGCPKVVARVRDPEHMNQMDFIKETMNIDYIVNPDLSITNEIYKYLVEKYTLTNGIFSSGKIAMVQFKVSKMPELIGLNMIDVSKTMTGLLVAAISRNGKVIIPHGLTTIEEEDTIYLLGERSQIVNIHSLVHEKGKFTDLQKVMIIGGGKTGFYLARKLSEFGASVKLIEQSRERCYYLSTHLDDVMVLNGDGTDTTLMMDENLDEMDAFVSATGFDEENLLLALMAKNHGIEDVISKVSHSNYAELIENLGVDMALNPQDIVTSNIVRYLQGSKKIVSSFMIQGQAEIVEIIAAKNMKLCNIPLKDLELPNGVLIAAIHRGNQVIIPNGNTEIKEDDKVSMICLLSDIGEIEKLITTRTF